MKTKRTKSDPDKFITLNQAWIRYNHFRNYLMKMKCVKGWRIASTKDYPIYKAFVYGETDKILKAIKELEKESGKSFEEFWKSFTMKSSAKKPKKHLTET